MSSDASFKLNTGATIPAVGLGTWQAPKGEVGKAVEHALKSGYKHIDAAWCYQVSFLFRHHKSRARADARTVQNEDEVRDQIFITSKV